MSKEQNSVVKINGRDFQIKKGRLDLNRQGIGDDGAIELAKALISGLPVTTLELYYNNIGNKGAKALTEAFTLNKSITEVKICAGNEYDQEASNALSKAVRNSNILAFDGVWTVNSYQADKMIEDLIMHKGDFQYQFSLDDIDARLPAITARIHSLISTVVCLTGLKSAFLGIVSN